jgi:hypothetical protein
MRSVSLLVLALEDHFSQIRIAVRSVCGDDELHLIVRIAHSSSPKAKLRRPEMWSKDGLEFVWTEHVRVTSMAYKRDVFRQMGIKSGMQLFRSFHCFRMLLP